MTTPLPQQITNVEKWIAELRSGKWKQARNRMKKGDTHCCLGVCAEAVCGMNIKNEFEGNYLIVDEACGMDSITANHCWMMNDTDQRDFPFIADWLETNHLPKLKESANAK